MQLGLDAGLRKRDDHMLTMTEGTSNTQHWFATALARYVQRRRAQLRLKPARAAELASMTLQEWESMEAGLVPAEDKLVRIADVLRANRSQLEILAYMSASSQSK